MLKFQLVVPAFNEASSLELLVRRVAASARAEGFSPEEFQLLIVENGSTDDSQKILKRLKLHEFGSWFDVLRLENNLGYGGGIWAGLQATTAPIIGWTHSDLQCEPRDAFTAFQKLRELESKKVIVKGVRFGRSRREILVSRVYELAARVLLGFRGYEINAQPKVFHREALQLVPNPPKNIAFDLYFLLFAARAGYSFHTIPVHFPARLYGKSSWSSSIVSRCKTIYGVLNYMYQLRKSEKVV